MTRGTTKARLRMLGILLSIFVLIVAIFAAFMVSTARPAISHDPWRDAELYRQFVHEYEDRHGDISFADGFTLVDNAIQMCHFLDTTPSLPAAFIAGTDSGMSSDQTVSVIELGVRIYCPQYGALFDGPSPDAVPTRTVKEDE